MGDKMKMSNTTGPFKTILNSLYSEEQAQKISDFSLTIAFTIVSPLWLSKIPIVNFVQPTNECEVFLTQMYYVYYINQIL